MKIGIVEDEKQWREKIEVLVHSYLKDKAVVNYEIVIMKNKKEALAEKNIDLLFLDVELADGENGFEIAEKLQENYSECRICFLTSHTEFARLGYKVNAFRYIDKLHLEEVEEAMDTFLQTRIQDRTIDCRTTEGQEMRLSLSKIVYVETSERKLRYHMVDGNQYLCAGGIGEIAEKLENYGFYQIQRSYIVNLKYIKTENSRRVILLDGTEIAIGRGHVEKFKKTYFDWRMKYDA